MILHPSFSGKYFFEITLPCILIYDFKIWSDSVPLEESANGPFDMVPLEKSNGAFVATLP